ncbi:MAG: hypothetical protein ACTHJ6_17380, partial [Oryzihumus sp.]
MTNVGLAGFGSAGQGIHAPLMRAAGLTVAAVSTSNAERAAQAREENPGVGGGTPQQTQQATPRVDQLGED